MKTTTATAITAHIERMLSAVFNLAVLFSKKLIVICSFSRIPKAAPKKDVEMNTTVDRKSVVLGKSVDMGGRPIN